MLKMMKTMMKGMGLGDAGLNMGKMSEMVSKSSHKERMLAKLEARRQASAAASASAAAQAEASRANVILEQKDAPNEFVFKVQLPSLSFNTVKVAAKIFPVTAQL